jgi:hypothetical protein
MNYNASHKLWAESYEKLTMDTIIMPHFFNFTSHFHKFN